MYAVTPFDPSWGRGSESQVVEGHLGLLRNLEQFGSGRLPEVDWTANPLNVRSGFPQTGSGESLTKNERKLRIHVKRFLSITYNVSD